MSGRWGFAAAAWLAAATVTTLLGLAAVNSIGDGILGGAARPFSAADVTSRLSATPPALPASAAPSAPAAAPSAVSGVLATAGGTVVATCTGGQAYLTSWSPAQGYQADHVSRGPAPTASIRFRTGKGRGIRLSVTCPGDVPTGSNTDD